MGPKKVSEGLRCILDPTKQIAITEPVSQEPLHQKGFGSRRTLVLASVEHQPVKRRASVFEALNHSFYGFGNN